MTAYDETKNANYKLENAKLYPTQQDKEIVSDAKDIKKNVVGLAQKIKDSANDKAHVAADYVQGRVEDLKNTSADVLNKAETRIKAKPGQSIAIAFVAGLVASFLFGRKSS